MLRNYRLRIVLLIVLLTATLTTPVRGAPEPFSKTFPENDDTGQPLLLTLSWEDSIGAVSYEYCYDTTNDNECEDDRWIPPGTVSLPLTDLTYNTTYYWQVRAIDDVGGMTYANNGAWWSFTTQSATLTVDKALTDWSVAPFALGTVLTYTVTATNTGEVTLSNVVVSDTLVTQTGGTSPCATLAVSTSCTLIGVYTVTQVDVDAGQIVNTGSSVSTETPTPVTDTVTTTIPQNPALAVDKALTDWSAAPFALGTVLTYTITATNTGDVTLANVVVSDTLITPSSVGCSTVALGASCVLTGSYAVQESDFMAGEIVNTATVTADDPNGDPLTSVTDTLTTPLIAAPPVANPDASPGNPIGQAVAVDVLANDIRGDLPIDPTSVVIVNPPSGSTLSPDGKLLVVPDEGIWLVNPTTGTITFTPDAGFTGNPTTITYTVDDVQDNTSNAATVTVAYTPPPVANDDASLGNAVGSAVTVTVLANDWAAVGRTLDPASVQIVGADTGSDGRTLTVSGEGVWTVAPDTGVITFTPEAGFEGNPTAIQYTVDDDQGNTSNVATVIVSYTNNPLARNDISSGNPVGSAVIVDVLDNDEAAPGRTLDPASVQISGTANPGDSLVVTGQGTWSVNTTTGAITFTPEEDFEGDPAAIAYTVTDDQSNASNVATVTVTYTEPPVANDDTSLNNPVGQPVIVDVLANDEAAAGRTLDPASVHITGTANPGESLVVAGQGTWSVNATTGAITFTPEEDFVGNPTPITYTVDDDQGNVSNAATVTVTYTEPPVANDDASLGNPVGGTVIVDVLANDTPAPGRTLDPASVHITGTANPGESLVVLGEGTWSVNVTTGEITFTPEEGFEGNPTPITYTVADDQGNTSNPATVTVSYTENPLARNDESAGNAIGSVVIVDVLLNDVAAPARVLDPTSVVIVGAPGDGKELLVADEGTWTVHPSTGEIAFTPVGGFAGNPTPITYTVNDDQGNVSNAATVMVLYTAPPVASDDVSTGNTIGSAVTVGVLDNDTAAPGRTLDPASVHITGTAAPGESLVVTGEGTWSVYTVTGAITFTPEESLEGNPTPIAYTVADDQGNVSNAATVTVTYTEPPVANDDASLGNPVGSAVIVDVLANDTAAPGRTLNPASVQITGMANSDESLVVPGQGAWSVYTMTGAITFTPEPDFAGNPTPIVYRVNDDQGNISNPATVTVTYTDKGFLVYLPLTVRHWPPIPPTPVLNAISNPDGDGNYTVSWNSTAYATSYVLQESITADFSDAAEVYSDTATTVSFSEQGPTRYYYRVQARNSYANSAWSNVRSVDVVWEKEPNDDALTQANGPLASGLTYYGRFPSGADRQDYYFISLQSAQSVELWLSNIAPGQDYDLTLRNTALQVVGHSGELGNANEHIQTGTLPAGLYYIQVFNRSGGGSTQVYHLRVSYPSPVLAASEGDLSMPAPRSSSPPPLP